MKISAIKIGNRSRKDLGDIDSLVRSIEQLGLLQPIVVRKDGTLIFGARRIAAFIALGRDEIPHHIVESLEEAHKCLLAERDENIERKSFTPLEALAMAERLEPFEKKAAKERQGTRTDRHPEKFQEVQRGNASDKIASAVGFSRPTLSKIKAVAQAAKAEPEKFAPIAKRMDETGKVDSAYKAVTRIQTGQSIKEGAKQDPEWRWFKILHDFYKFINSTRDAGGIKKLCGIWSQKGREEYVSELKRISAEIQKWIDALEEDAA